MRSAASAALTKSAVAECSVRPLNGSTTKRHRAVAPHLADYDLGSSEEDAAHVLLLDREKQVATVAPVADARTFLESQWPEQEPMTPEQEERFRAEFERLLEEQ